MSDPILTDTHTTTPLPPRTVGWDAQVPSYDARVDMPQAFRQFADTIPEDFPIEQITQQTGVLFQIGPEHLQKFLVGVNAEEEQWNITGGLDVGFQVTIDPLSAPINIVIDGGLEYMFPHSQVQALSILTKISETEWILSQ
jgi:hypothetical protein